MEELQKMIQELKHMNIKQIEHIELKNPIKKILGIEINKRLQTIILNTYNQNSTCIKCNRQGQYITESNEILCWTHSL